MMTCLWGGLVDLYLNVRQVIHPVYMLGLRLMFNFKIRSRATNVLVQRYCNLSLQDGAR